jgi:hypothetical protein
VRRPALAASFGRPAVSLLAIVLGTSLASSGCVTTLGYVPEYIKPKADPVTLKPTYAEVKKWSLDVLDGYDSRATMNRQALYFGALLAAAGVAAMAGLAAFDSGGSAIVGIPIGTGFLAGTAAIYNSEEKAEIYGRAGRYIKGLIVLSEQRINRHARDVAMKTTSELEAAQQALLAARRRYADAEAQLGSQKRLAGDVRARAEIARAAPDVPDPERNAAEKSAQALERLVAAAEAAVGAAGGALAATEDRFTSVALRQRAMYTLVLATDGMQAASASGELAPALPAMEAERKELDKLFYDGEAVCLQRDVNEVMNKVADHIAVLDPKNLAARLRAVGPSPAGAGGAAAAVPPADLSDLALPAKSVCD